MWLSGSDEQSEELEEWRAAKEEMSRALSPPLTEAVRLVDAYEAHTGERPPPLPVFLEGRSEQAAEGGAAEALGADEQHLDPARAGIADN